MNKLLYIEEPAVEVTEEAEELSPWLWLPCVWLFINSSRILVSISLEDIYTTSASGIKAQATYFTLIVLGFLCMALRKADWERLIKRNILVFLFFAYMGISIGWSDYPIVAIKRYVKTFGILLMALIVVTEHDPYEAFLAVMRRTYTALVGLSALLIFVIPSYGIRGNLWLGVTSHKNELGELTCVGAIFFLSQIIDKGLNKKTRKEQILFAFAVIILANCNSMTSLVIFTFATSLFILFSLKISSRFIGTFIIAIYSFGLSLFFFIDNLLPSGLLGAFFDAIGRDMTFTGRYELWQDVIAIAIKRPWFGYGYESFWIDDIHNLWEIYIWRPNQGHSGYVDLFATLGITGIVIVFLVAGYTFLNASRQLITHPLIGRLRMIYVIAILWYNISESSLCTSATSAWVLFTIIIVRSGEHISTHVDLYYPHNHMEELIKNSKYPGVARQDEEDYYY